MKQSTFDNIEERILWQLPFIRGTWFFVDPSLGHTTSSGRTPATALNSIALAYAKCTSGRGDGIALLSQGITTAGCTSYLTAVLDWTKWGITVVGVCSNIRFAHRARVANHGTTGLALAYLIDVQGSNNAFKNLSITNYGTDAAAIGGVIVSGNRNSFEGIHMVGGGHATPGTLTTTSSLTLSGSENFFKDCVFGTDTYDRGDTVNQEIILSGGGMRNRFERCEVLSKRSAGTTAGAIRLSGGNCITRDVIFDDCHFSSYRDGNISAEATLIVGDVPNNGMVLFRNCSRSGYTDWCAVAATARVSNNLGAGHEAGGAMVAANPS